MTKQTDVELEFGPVSLVGAGPGDPDLMTVRALRHLEAAEVVLHDNLISDEVLALARSDAQLINVGKRCGDIKDRGLQQEEIHELLLAHSRRGRKVVRLKCGDPFVYGRGGEELEYLAKHGVPTEVVPGITTALGAAASCKMPLTHRTFGVNQVRFITGQSKAKTLPEVEWDELARNAKHQTLVFYMGWKSIGSICEKLLEHGAPADTPMAIIENATMQEKVLSATVSTMPALATKHKDDVSGPVIIFMGSTVTFPDMLAKLEDARPHKRARMMSPDEC